MREQILGRDSPSRIESLGRIQQELRRNRNVASIRLESAAVFAKRTRIPPPRNIKVSNSSTRKSHNKDYDILI